MVKFVFLKAILAKLLMIEFYKGKVSLKKYQVKLKGVK